MRPEHQIMDSLPDRHPPTGWLRIGAILLLGLGLRAGNAQEITGMHGADIGGLEPWDIPLPELSMDAGLARRTAEVLYPYLLRLDARESLLSGIATNVWLDPVRVLDELEGMQPELGRDVLTVMAVLRKHAAEVNEWSGGVASNLAVGGDLTEAALSQALNIKPNGSPAPDPVARRHWVAAAWAPLAAGMALLPAPQRTAEALGLSAPAHAADPAWAWLAFLATLRRTAAQADARTYAVPALQTLLNEFREQLLVPRGLGDLAAPARVHDQVEMLIGCQTVAALFRPELLDRWTMEGGDFVFDAFCAQADGAVRAALESAVLSAVLSDGFAWQERAAAELAAGYEVRRARYAVLAAELGRNMAADAAAGPDVARLYGYYLLLLARFPPCLSPFRAEQVNADWLRFVMDDAAPAPVVRDEAESGATPGPIAGAPAAMPYLCLLQSDAWRDNQGIWQWRPRAAGRRHHLDRFLNQAGLLKESE